MDINRMRELELNDGELTKEEIEEGWHFCIEWDGLLIKRGDPEAECCNCFEKEKENENSH